VEQRESRILPEMPRFARHKLKEMVMNKKFRGVGVALVTPFKSDYSLDEAAFERLIDFQIEEGTNYLVPCGTTGENPALTHGEHRRVVVAHHGKTLGAGDAV